MDEEATSVPGGEPVTPASPRRRLLWWVAGGLAIVLVGGSTTWWGIARAEAHTRAEALVAQVSAVHDDARAANEDAAAAAAGLTELRDTAVAPLLEVAAAAPDLLSAELVAQLTTLRDEADGALSGAAAAAADTTFPDDPGELTDRVLWDEESVLSEAASARARLNTAAETAKATTESATDIHSRITETLASLGGDAAGRAAQSYDALEHAGDQRAALSEYSTALLEATEIAVGSTAAASWTPVIEHIQALPGVQSSARATHDARVAEIEAARQAEEARRAAEQQQRNSSRNTNAGSGGGGSGGSGGGGGNRGSDGWCAEVNWTGYIILVPC